MRLLVSVRSLEEAEQVVGFVDVLDIKEPNAGSLGAASSKVINEIVRWHGERVPVSAAMGELLELRDDWWRALPSLRFAKFGLANCASLDDWPDRWKKAAKQLPAATQVVAVYYADQQVARCPNFEQILEQAVELQCPYLLIDTYSKSDRRLWDWLPVDALHRLQDRAQQSGLKLAVAGQLNALDAPTLQQLQPAVVAVRSAVCRQDRQSSVCREQLLSFVQQVIAPATG